MAIYIDEDDFNFSNKIIQTIAVIYSRKNGTLLKYMNINKIRYNLTLPPRDN